jgi:flagellar biosynthesis protein FliQ
MLLLSIQQCKRSVEEKTLFFMPHCGKAMYNNLLWANWSVDKLEKMAVIGNSFSSYHEKSVITYAKFCLRGLG